MPEDRRIGWAIVGCGRVAERRVAPVFSKVEDARLAAVCSRSIARARHFAERHGDPTPYDRLDDLLSDAAVDVVYIATPHALHASQAIACLEAGKHVLVDKPMATSASDARKMADAAGAAGRLLSVMQQQRYHAANMHLFRLRDEGQLGSLNIIRIHVGLWIGSPAAWRFSSDLAGGGVAMDLGPHAVDLLLELAGDARRVSAYVASLQFDAAVEDFCTVRIELACGAVGLLDLSYCSHDYGGRVEVYGSEGSFFADGSMKAVGPYRTQLRRGETAGPIEEDTANDCFAEAVEDFTDAVQHDGEPSISAADGVRVMRVIDAIYESARTGRPVDLESV